MLTTILKVIGLISLSSSACFSQERATMAEKKQAPAQVSERAHQPFYQLSFVARELENDRVVNSRSYLIIVSGERGSIRAVEKVPFASTTGQKNEWQQIEVGMAIDCGQVVELGDKVSLHIMAEISSVAENHGDSAPPPSLPVIKDNRWESIVVVPLKDPTVIYSSDDPASKRKMQLQLTATPIRVD